MVDLTVAAVAPFQCPPGYVFDINTGKCVLAPTPATAPPGTTGGGGINIDTSNLAFLIANAAVSGLKWIRDQIFQFRQGLITSIVNAINTPIVGIFILIGLLATAVLLGFLYSIIAATGIPQMVENFISGVQTFLATMGQILAIDILITISQSAALLNAAWAAKLAEVYDALSALSLEIETDFSFVLSVAEISRIELKGMNALVPNSFFTSDVDYANGLVTWLQGVKAKLNDYEQNPQQIFLDIQAAVIENRIASAQTATDNVLAAVDKSVNWIDTTGHEVVDNVNQIFVLVGEIDPKLQALVDKYWTPLYKQINDFIDKYWKPFKGEYDIVIGDITIGLQKQGISLAYLESKIQTPADLFRSLQGLSPVEQQAQTDEINAVLGAYKQKKLSALAQAADDAIQFVNPFLPYDITFDLPTPQQGTITPTISVPVEPTTGESVDILYSDDSAVDVPYEVIGNGG